MGRIYITLGQTGLSIKNKTSETTARSLCRLFSYIHDINDIHWVSKFSVSYSYERFILFFHDLKIDIFFRLVEFSVHF